MEEAKKAAGTKSKTLDDGTEALVFSESEDVLKQIADLEASRDATGNLTPAAGRKLEKLREQRKLKHFKNAEKELYVGADQTGQQAQWADTKRVKIKDYGHRYESAVDTIVMLLFGTGLRRADLSRMNRP